MIGKHTNMTFSSCWFFLIFDIFVSINLHLNSQFLFFLQSITITENLSKQQHKASGRQVEGKVHWNIDVAYHPTDDGIVEDGKIESDAHDIEADKVALGKETSIANVLDN